MTEHSRSTLPYVERHKARGEDYAESFSPELNPYRAMMWRLEQRALSAALHDRLASGKMALLDFACGTGRILGHLHTHMASVTGVDVSSSMMDVAKKVVPTAELIEADLTKEDVLGTRRFDLITAFRFFPNAEPDLRRSILRVLARHLAPDGLLVFNNHKNRNSLTHRISRLLGREVRRGTMSHDEVEALLADAGLRIVKMIPLGTLPASDRHLLLPVGLLERVEWGLSGVRPLSTMAQNVIYLCAGAKPGDAQRQSGS